jgi:hypothetical protein
MSAIRVYRMLLLLRGSWLMIEWFFGWGAHSSVTSLTLLHPYASLAAHVIAVMFWLIIMVALWFFKRWARLIFVLLLAVGLVTSPFRMHYSLSSPPSFVMAIGAFVLLLNGAIVAMCFLPPVRDCFVAREA